MFQVDISLWGYTESTIEPRLIHIANLGSQLNSGMMEIIPADYKDRDDGPDARSCR